MAVIFRRLADIYGWSPDVIADLTFVQAEMFLKEEDSLKDRNPNSMSFGSKQQFRQWLRTQREQ